MQGYGYMKIDRCDINQFQSVFVNFVFSVVSVYV